MSVRILSIVLPQFHPIPENNLWWGKGFTEWTKVVSATPRYQGHYQPHLPTELGFYDLRLPEAREAQALLAKEYGIYGFCYYHYWFNGRRLLERPVNEILTTGKPDFPFMLCWANENWSRNWDGGFTDTLLTQHYSEEDDRKHMQYLCREVFSDTRYIRINNKPIFAVYRTELFPDIQKTVEIWRETAYQEGLEGLYLMRVESISRNIPPQSIGMDAAIDFQPNWQQLPPRKGINGLNWRLHKAGIYHAPAIKDRLYDYPTYVENQLRLPFPDYPFYPALMPGWDNSPRRKEGAVIFEGNSPAIFGHWLKETIRRFQPPSEEENFIFINAWNEWAEGNHLEPDEKWGTAFLQQIKESIRD